MKQAASNFLARLFGVEEGETPLPYQRLITVTILLFAESVNGYFPHIRPIKSAIFSYVPYLVLDFKPGALEGLDDVPKSLAGYYAGMVASSFFFGQLLSSYFWGNLSDRFGRRPILLFGALGSLFSNIFFGFGRSFWWFVFFRFLTGFLNGNVGVAKSYIGEITDSTNQSRGLAFIGLSSGGVFVGSFMGGLLARPAKQYPDRFSEDGVFGYFPYLATSLFGATIILLGFILAYFYVEESPKKNSKAKEGDDDLSLVGILKSAVKKAFGMCCTTGEEYSVFKDKIALWACLNYALIGLFMIFDAEIWPLLIVLDPEQGGLGFTTKEIGLSQASTGVSFTVTSLFIQARLTNKFGFINSSIISALVWGFMNLLTPYLHYTTSIPGLMWTLVICNRLIRGFVGQIYFGCSMVLINNSVMKEHLGAVNGVGQTFVSLARTCGPFLSANIFAWSASNGHGWPLNYHFVFLLVSTLCGFGALEAYLLPRSLNKPKDEQNRESNDHSELYDKLDNSEKDSLKESDNNNDNKIEMADLSEKSDGEVLELDSSMNFNLSDSDGETTVLSLDVNLSDSDA